MARLAGASAAGRGGAAYDAGRATHPQSPAAQRIPVGNDASVRTGRSAGDGRQASSPVPVRHAWPSRRRALGRPGPASGRRLPSSGRAARDISMGSARAGRALRRPPPRPAPDSRHALPVYTAGTLVDWQQRATVLRRQLQVALGLWPVPTRSPLNARVHGTVDRDGYVDRQGGVREHPGALRDRQCVPPERQAGPARRGALAARSLARRPVPGRRGEGGPRGHRERGRAVRLSRPSSAAGACRAPGPPGRGHVLLRHGRLRRQRANPARGHARVEGRSAAHARTRRPGASTARRPSCTSRA